MPTKAEIIGNTLIKELIAIRTDTLWRMLALLKKGQLPEVDEEGATGKLDNKGAIFIPGGLIYQDVDEKEIEYRPQELDDTLFRKKIRESLKFDNATLLFPDGVVSGVNLDTGFFTRTTRIIYTAKQAAHRRIRRVSDTTKDDVDALDVIRSHSPPYVDPPYGSRTRISSCVSVGLIDPNLYFAYCKRECNLSKQVLRNFSERLNSVLEPPEQTDGDALFPPHVVVCHDTRYKENSLTGLIRILGIGRFGEFSTITFEALDAQLAAELKRREVGYRNHHVFADYGGVRVLCILRTYEPTSPGKRSNKHRIDLISAEKDVGLDLEAVARQARRRYRIRAERGARSRGLGARSGSTERAAR
ncbi:MAG: hypothetical protein QNK03_23305 [Myxococcota bacterium]|nr:hypothetical protein [Myxococcota bacterium]